MELRRELFLTVGTLVLLNLLLAFGSISLLVRMGPAIERILRENVRSLVAAEQMLAEFAASPGQAVPEGARERIHGAFASASRNVTEEEEEPVLRSIEQDLPEALAGDRRARAEVVQQLGELTRINHDAMNVAGAEARRLGDAGAWAAVAIGLLTFALSLLVLVRLRKRFVGPLDELHDVLEGVRRGERLRRCHVSECPFEMTQVVQSVNRLLDERLNEHPKKTESGELEQLALAELFERQGGPTALVDRQGHIVRSSRAMLELLASERFEQLKAAFTDEHALRDEVRRIAVQDRGWIVVLSPDGASKGER